MRKNFGKLLLFIAVLILSAYAHLHISEDVSQNWDDIFESKQFHLAESPTLEDPKLKVYLNKLSAKICELYKIPIVPIDVADSLIAQAVANYSNRTILISKGMLFAVESEAQLEDVG